MLQVAIIALFVEGILVSKIDSECVINIVFTTVIVAIVLVAFMISLPQIETNKNARNTSTVDIFMPSMDYFCRWFVGTFWNCV